MITPHIPPREPPEESTKRRSLLPKLVLLFLFISLVRMVSCIAEDAGVVAKRPRPSTNPDAFQRPVKDSRILKKGSVDKHETTLPEQ